MPNIHERFVAVFNAGAIADLAALLTDDATAQVLGSPFPVEEGRDAIARTSLPHVLDPSAALVASVGVVDDEPWILLCGAGGAGPIDTAIRLDHDADRVTRLEYVVAPHRPDALRALGTQLGLPTVAD